MKYTALLPLALALAYLALAAPDLGAADAAKAAPVVVDPTDLRQPVPDPELGLTDKYDGKVVRFSGVVRTSTLDKKTKEHHSELHFDIIDHVKVKGKEKVVGKETIVVAVTFGNEEKALHQLFAKDQRVKGPGVRVTVQGKGSVMVDGTLVITEAVIVK